MGKIESKDWDRMTDLVLKGDNDAHTVSKSIKDKNKAMNRFVAGLKLSKTPLKYDEKGWSGPYSSNYRELGNLAIKLGATSEEIQSLYDSTEIPSSNLEKLSKLGGKKLSNRFVGSISKTVLDLGLDITYLPCNGNSITTLGREAMSRNGRKWTIGYKSEIDMNGNKVKLFFDVITDEGDGPSKYVLDNESSNMFSRMVHREFGKNEFISMLKMSLSSK
jgi:hypothetical protein